MAQGYEGAQPVQELSEQERDDIVKEVRERIDDAWQHDRDNREDMASDFKFLAGDQWPAQVRTEREADGRPMLTINRLPQFVKQVTNDIRQADLAIKVSPVDDESDPEMAKIFNGLLRQIQHQSSAKAVYSTAAEHQAGGGFGCFRICTQYVDDTVFDQEIRIKIVKNPLSAFWDPAAIEPDRSDAMWWAITEMWPRKHFKAKYPSAREESVSVPNVTNMDTIFWHVADTVRVAEYWRKVPIIKLLAMLDTGETIDATEIQGAAEGMMLADPETGQPAAQIVRMRECETFRVECFLVSGAEVLEGPSPWPGKFIPIVPVIGAEVPLEEGTYRHGIVRFARDPQQLYNFYRTATAEIIGGQPKAPYLVTPKMIAKFKAQWDSHNVKNRPYLLYEADLEAGGGPKREPPPVLSDALVQEGQIANDDMKGTTGIYDASLGARSNETAGVAIAQRQREGDVANYHYIDNLQRSLEHAGRILLDLIPKVYDNERVIRILGDDDEEDFVPINRVMMAQDGMPVLLNDLSAARFDIKVTIGRSYTTRRMEAADSLLEFAKAVPNAAQISGDLIAKNLDFPEAEEMAKRLKRTIPEQILYDPEDPEAQPPRPDPMQMEAMRLELEKAMAEIEKIKADIESTDANTIKTLVDADQADADARAGYVQEPQVVRGKSNGGNGNGGGRPRRQSGTAPPRPQRRPEGPPPSAAFQPEPDQYLPPDAFPPDQGGPGMMQLPEDMAPPGGFRPPPGSFR